MSDLQKHIARVEAWAESRGLYETDDPMVQFWKLMEEVAELGMAVEKQNISEIVDAIGDVRVCLINVCHIAGTAFREGVTFAPSYGSQDKLMWRLLQESADIHGHIFNGSRDFSVSEFNCCLYELCDTFNLTMQGCDEAAWSAIKDRKGTTVGGEFIKD